MKCTICGGDLRTIASIDGKRKVPVHRDANDRYNADGSIHDAKA